MKAINISSHDRIDKMYAYQKNAETEQRIDEMEVAYQYKSSQIDPTRLLCKWERSAMHKKKYHINNEGRLRTFKTDVDL